MTHLLKPNKGVYPFYSQEDKDPSQIEFSTWLGKKPFYQKRIKRECNKHKCSIFKKRYIQVRSIYKSREKNKISSFTMKENEKIALLSRAANLAYHRKAERFPSPDPTATEQIGIQVNVLRRKQQKNICWLSIQTGYLAEELIAFETGILPPCKVLEMLPKIRMALSPALGDEKLPYISLFPTM